MCAFPCEIFHRKHCLVVAHQAFLHLTVYSDIPRKATVLDPSIVIVLRNIAELITVFLRSVVGQPSNSGEVGSVKHV